MVEAKDNNVDDVLDTSEQPAADGYYGEEMAMDGDLDISFLDDDDESVDHDSYDD
ncbi:MAG: hypothetical protein LBM12_02250 [Candidatus Nomurabacteria bacterium]|jgi:hypothetical protein|nr:hypothetical protein [Candidatus Nomurabacteria bacterium]